MQHGPGAVPKQQMPPPQAGQWEAKEEKADGDQLLSLSLGGVGRVAHPPGVSRKDASNRAPFRCVGKAADPPGTSTKDASNRAAEWWQPRPTCGSTAALTEKVLLLSRLALVQAPLKKHSWPVALAPPRASPTQSSTWTGNSHCKALGIALACVVQWSLF